MKKYQQLTYEERIKIACLKEQGISIRSIAQELGRSPNTISRELKEKKVNGIYLPKKAQHKTYWRRYTSKRDCMKLGVDGELQRGVIEKLKMKWSPERISGYMKRNGVVISKDAIYRFVYARGLEYLLFSKRYKKKRGPKRGKMLKTHDERRYIEDRPPLDGSGHFEADFIVSSQSSWVLLVLVDRYTRETVVKKLPNRKHTTVHGVFSEFFNQRDVKTLTLDNDIAFHNWKQYETEVYFTHPYCSWEKGLVENTNHWIRLFVPKKRDIVSVTEEELDAIHEYLNGIPRQCLGFRTAYEVSLTVREVS